MFLSETLILIKLYGAVASFTTSRFSTNLHSFWKSFSISSDINGTIGPSVKKKHFHENWLKMTFV